MVVVNVFWDGGFVWSEDCWGRDWIVVVCEGIGVSLWWFNKDYFLDELDSMFISFIVFNGFMVVVNGNLLDVDEGSKEICYDWFVFYFIDNYNVMLNIGYYVYFFDVYYVEDGDILVLDYYVIDYNEVCVKEYFEQMKIVLVCYEKYLDKYLFWEDGFVMVEMFYLGMEY